MHALHTNTGDVWVACTREVFRWASALTSESAPDRPALTSCDLTTTAASMPQAGPKSLRRIFFCRTCMRLGILLDSTPANPPATPSTLGTGGDRCWELTSFSPVLYGRRSVLNQVLQTSPVVSGLGRSLAPDWLCFVDVHFGTLTSKVGVRSPPRDSNS